MRILTGKLAHAIAIACLGMPMLATSAQNARKGDLPVEMREVLGARLNRDGPASIQKLLGKTAVIDTGDASGATRVWCYRVGQTPSAAVVSFSANREMAGDKYEADEIRVTRGDKARRSPSCARARTSGLPATPAGLGLGLSEQRLLQLLGKPTSRGGDSVVYEWETTQLLSPTEKTYAYWNARRRECFEGGAPYSNVGASIVAKVDSFGIYEFVLVRGASSIC